MRKFFKFDELGTNYRSEIIGGVTTFFAMAYIVVVNPAILADGGFPKGATMTATIVAAILGTLLMALYARRPFALAPFMCENAFVAYTVCVAMGVPWQTALGAVFLGGVLFVVTTALRVRSWVARAMPDSLKHSFAVGLGFFLMFIGLNTTGLVRLGVEGSPVKIGDLSSAGPLLAVFCILLVCILMIRKVPAALLIGMLGTSLVAYVVGVAQWPARVVSMPPSMAPTFLKLDIPGALSRDVLPVVLVLFVLDFVDTIGTLVGLSARAGFLDKSHNLPDLEKPLMADAVDTVTGALIGTSTTGTYIESAAGIEAGAKTGFASVVTAAMFLFCLFFAPIFLAVPAPAYGAVLVVVGFLMLAPVAKIPFDDYTELFPAVATIVLMSFTYNIAFGMTAGFVLYPLFKVISGRRRELNWGMWVLFALSAVFFLLYPYGRI